MTKEAEAITVKWIGSQLNRDNVPHMFLSFDANHAYFMCMDDFATAHLPFIPITDYSPLSFNEKPSDEFIAKFREHVRLTGRPEDFPGLFYGRIDKNEPLQVLCSVSVKRVQRLDGDVPCPICRNPSQFLDGYLVWFYERGCVSVIGETCAANIQRAMEDFRASGATKIAELDLKWQLPLTTVWQTQVQGALEAAERIRNLSTEFNKIGRKCRDAVRPFVKTGTLLTARAGEPLREWRLQGGDALNSHFTAHNRLKRCLELISKHLCDPSLLAVETRIFELSKNSIVMAASKDFDTISEEYRLAIAQMELYRRFFHTTNLAAISNWGRDIGAKQFDMQVRSTTSKCSIKIDDKQMEFSSAAWDYSPVLEDQR